MSELVPLSDVPGWIMRTTERKAPTVSKEIKRGALRAAWHDPLVTEQRIKTGTLQASTIPYAETFVGRGLPYQEENEPLPESEIDQVIEAAEIGDTVGIAEDAMHNGELYGIFVEARFGLFAKTRAALRARMPLIIAAAIGRTIFRRGA